MHDIPKKAKLLMGFLKLLSELHAVFASCALNDLSSLLSSGPFERCLLRVCLCVCVCVCVCVCHIFMSLPLFLEFPVMKSEDPFLFCNKVA